MQHKHTYSKSINDQMLSVQWAVFGARGWCHWKLLPWPGLELGTSHNHCLLDLVL